MYFENNQTYFQHVKFKDEFRIKQEEQNYI